MTVPPTDPGAPTPRDLPDDEPLMLASAAADGSVIGPDEAVSGTNPQVTAIAAQFALLRDHLREPFSLDAGQRDAHLGAALAAFDALGLGAEESSADATAGVVSLEVARRRRARRLAPVFAAAAAAAAVGIVIGTVANRGGSNDNLSLNAKEATTEVTAAGVATPAARTEVGAAAAGNEPLAAAATDDISRSAAISASATDAAAMATPDSTVLGDTGTSDGTVGEPIVVDSPAQLAPLAQSVLEAHRTNGVPLPSNPCPNVRGVAIARILWSQHDAVLVVVPNVDAPTQAVVIDSTSCAPDISVALKG